ncbi:hypothetical protein K437DRAFT_27649 [Tilletiaria anomala UBC 951]|uniref:Uncharacterized protein n=1 Tax=Tilletiaria anomala (strain ATCC 24038 / CBS 436.72 / UBC 951) TaxID=1037660 RepID=A0A066VIF3_TILAU|nr:uncharacterized protein K437DRAFT_27649 [Tilletiaria anomala UBC 951]KDN38330.1 hypothetical protein K437DRAFT_27649 [Tilletiaria anomala UBC 951]
MTINIAPSSWRTLPPALRGCLIVLECSSPASPMAYGLAAVCLLEVKPSGARRNARTNMGTADAFVARGRWSGGASMGR